MTNGSRVLLAGDAAARPAGLERALTRAGFLLAEALPPGEGLRVVDLRMRVRPVPQRWLPSRKDIPAARKA